MKLLTCSVTFGTKLSMITLVVGNDQQSAIILQQSALSYHQRVDSLLKADGSKLIADSLYYTKFAGLGYV